MDYEKDTRSAYDVCKAKSYQEQQTEGLSWMRITTWRERLCVEKILRRFKSNGSAKILDIPCGTGILADILGKYFAYVVTSDISMPMLSLARKEYNNVHQDRFVQADITRSPFKQNIFEWVVTIGLMHRLPKAVRTDVLREVVALSSKYIVVSYSIDSSFYRIRQWFIKKIRPSHRSAPSPVLLQDVKAELKSNGLRIKNKLRVMPFLSAEVIFFLEKG